MKWELIAAIVLGGVLAFLLLSSGPGRDNDLASVLKAEIEVEDAVATWSPEMHPLADAGRHLAALVSPRLVFEYATTAVRAQNVGSDALNAAAGLVGPRLVFEYATTSNTWSSVGSQAISDAGAEVRPRILMDYAATSSLDQDLRVMGELDEAALTVGSRILVEHAADGGLTFTVPPAEIPAARRNPSEASSEEP